MKTMYTNKLISGGIGLMLLSVSVFPLSTHAATSTSTRNFCKQLPSLKSKVTIQIKAGEDKLGAHRKSVQDKLVSAWGERDKKLTLARTQANTNKESQFTSLYSKAKNDREKSAITTFKNTINSAIDLRRSTVDSSVKTYRDAVKALYNNRESMIDTYIITLRSEIDSAFTKAQTDCVAQVDPASIKTTLQNSIKSAQDKFKTNKQSQESYESRVKNLASINDQTIAKAKTDFENAIEQAKATLKAALPATK